MRAKFEDSRTFDKGSWSLFNKVQVALKRCGFQIIHLDAHRKAIQARSARSLWGWGEQIQVQLTEEGRLKACSESALPTQQFDWGKNRRNVTRFYHILTQLLAA